ncbi:hypothetical protein CIPAW_15G069600 [Carya illinoinensis]|uniref:Uncharacterized protein n=1 Tax=Carya illinoinensis TaxID=32201 RepID=A0A8T1NCB3_CARIL|nr:hypothetical protein CIPAW_15G069600 [Carya illinoinensis]
MGAADMFFSQDGSLSIRFYHSGFQQSWLLHTNLVGALCKILIYCDLVVVQVVVALEVVSH